MLGFPMYLSMAGFEKVESSIISSVDAHVMTDLSYPFPKIDRPKEDFFHNQLQDIIIDAFVLSHRLSF